MFPEKCGSLLGGKTFQEVFDTCPKEVEFVDKLWGREKTTGLWLEFFEFVKTKLSNPKYRKAHEKRCKIFVANEKTPPATYMRRFK